jgi:hypothetical protein
MRLSPNRVLARDRRNCALHESAHYVVASKWASEAGVHGLPRSATEPTSMSAALSGNASIYAEQHNAYHACGA